MGDTDHSITASSNVAQHSAYSTIECHRCSITALTDPNVAQPVRVRRSATAIEAGEFLGGGIGAEGAKRTLLDWIETGQQTASVAVLCCTMGYR
jgi:hypothetical protein